MSQKEYVKHIESDTFLTEWILLSLVLVPLMLLVSICFYMTFNIAFSGTSNIENFIDKNFIYINLEIAFFAAFLLSFISSGLKYRSTIKKNYASMTDKMLNLEFSNFTVFWHQINEIIIEGERKLIINSDNTRKEFDLQWLQKKERIYFKCQLSLCQK